MKKGFVTIATGDDRYYDMARTLLRSYRQHCESPIRFALIADRHNEYTKEFDDVVILENPAYSWMDKLKLLKSCPYEENIFIDADCIVYQDINFLWPLFEKADDFSCFGSVLPMDSTDGWFTREAEKLYPIHFITHLHGMLYYIRKGKTIEEMSQWCERIISDYHSVSFKAFNDVLADEPVFALAMAIMNLKPVTRKPEYYCFVPFSTKLSTDYSRSKVSYSNPKDDEVKSCAIVHWGNKNTVKYQYRTDAYTVKLIHEKNATYPMFPCYCQLIRCMNWVIDEIGMITSFASWFIDRFSVKIKKILHRQR